MSEFIVPCKDPNCCWHRCVEARAKQNPPKPPKCTIVVREVTMKITRRPKDGKK